MIRKHSGFTLMELMIVVAIVGILSAIAYPSYQNQVRKSKRADGKEALLNVQMAQEKWRANHATYSSTLAGTNCGTVTATGLCLSSTSTGGYYTVTIAAGADAVGFVASAAAVGAQASDKVGSTSCTPLTLTVNSTNPTGLKGPAACW